MTTSNSSPNTPSTNTAKPAHARVEQPSTPSHEMQFDLNYGALLGVVVIAFFGFLASLRRLREIKADRGGKVTYSTSTDVSAKVLGNEVGKDEDQ